MEQRPEAANAGQLERQTQHFQSALGKLYALCAMYQDMDYFLRPVIEDLEAYQRDVGLDGGPFGEGIPADEGNRLPGDSVVGGEVVRRVAFKEGS